MRNPGSDAWRLLWRILVLLALTMLLLIALGPEPTDPRFGRILPAAHRAEQIERMRASLSADGWSEDEIQVVEARIIRQFPTLEEVRDGARDR